MEEKFIDHPKTTSDVYRDERLISLAADEALHATNDSDRTRLISEITTELNRMTPEERALLAKRFESEKEIFKDDPHSTYREGAQIIPEPALKYDSNHDLESITFRSASGDEAFGNQITIDLKDRNRTNDPPTIWEKLGKLFG